MKKIHLLLVGAGCAMTLLAAGCSKEATVAENYGAGSAGPTADVAAPTVEAPLACKVFTAELAKKYLGEAGTPNENNNPTVSNCTYSSASGGITLLIKSYATDEAAAIERDGAIKASNGLSGVDPEMVEGLGDKAYWAGGKLNQINVFKDRKWYIISAFMTGYGKDKAIEIMKDMLANS